MSDEKPSASPVSLEHLLKAVDSATERLTQLRIDVAQHETQIIGLLKDVAALHQDFVEMRRDVPNREHVEAELRRLVTDIGELQSARPDRAIANLQTDLERLITLVGPVSTEDDALLPTQRKLLANQNRVVYGAAGVTGVGTLLYFVYQVIEALRALSGN